MTPDMNGMQSEKIEPSLPLLARAGDDALRAGRELEMLDTGPNQGWRSAYRAGSNRFATKGKKPRRKPGSMGRIASREAATVGAKPPLCKMTEWTQIARSPRCSQ